MVDLELNALNNRLMSPKEQKIAAGLSVFLTAALPTSVGVIAFRSQPILANIIRGEAHTLPTLTNFFFNHFQGSLICLFIFAVVATWVSFKAYHQSSGENQSIKFPELLVALAFSSLISIVYLSLFIFSTALPVYSKLTER